MFALLKNVGTHELTRSLIFRALIGQPHDRSMFLDVVLAHTETEKDSVREKSLELLAEIGSAGHANKVIPLILHDSPGIRTKAVKVLRAIGDSRHVESLEAILADPPKDMPRQGRLYQSIQAAVVELKARPQKGDKK
jgi:HEAT repeat protein